MDTNTLKKLAQALSLDDTSIEIMRQRLGFPHSNDYDMTAFTRAYLSGDPLASQGYNPNDNSMHFPDTYKRANHPTMSRESILGRLTGGPEWHGGDMKGGAQSWQLRSPSGSVVASEAPWWNGGIAVSPDRQRALGMDVEQLIERFYGGR